MMDFGFKLSAYRKHLTSFRLEPGARICIGCGSCSASCPAGSLSGMSMRKVLLALQRGQDVQDMLRCCMLCGKCVDACPAAALSIAVGRK